MKTIERMEFARPSVLVPPARELEPAPVTRLPQARRPRLVPTPPPRRRWLTVVVIAFVVALATIGATIAYTGRGAEIDRLRARSDRLASELRATVAADSATIAGLEQARSELTQRVETLKADLHWADLDRRHLALELSKLLVRFDAARARLTRLRGTLDSLHSFSAVGMSALAPQSGLPEAVAQMRTAIGRAATTGDLVGLRNLAMRGGRAFAYAWDTDLRPAAYWAVQEIRGEQPTRYLVGMLGLDHATRVRDGRTTYIWPAAAAYDTWSAVPRADRVALHEWYGRSDFEVFRRMNAYIGYRVRIMGNGDWTQFIVGD